MLTGVDTTPSLGYYYKVNTQDFMTSQENLQLDSQVNMNPEVKEISHVILKSQIHKKTQKVTLQKRK